MLSSIATKFRVQKKSFVTFFVGITLILYFLFYTIFGNRGIVDYFALKAELNSQNSIKNQLSTKIEDKQNLVNRMENQSLDVDLLDEQVRKNLGYAKTNEVIIFNKEKNEKSY